MQNKKKALIRLKNILYQKEFSRNQESLTNSRKLQIGNMNRNVAISLIGTFALFSNALSSYLSAETLKEEPKRKNFRYLRPSFSLPFPLSFSRVPHLIFFITCNSLIIPPPLGVMELIHPCKNNKWLLI